jgi:hypothetical protein
MHQAKATSSSDFSKTKSIEAIITATALCRYAMHIRCVLRDIEASQLHQPKEKMQRLGTAFCNPSQQTHAIERNL